MPKQITIRNDVLKYIATIQQTWPNVFAPEGPHRSKCSFFRGSLTITGNYFNSNTAASNGGAIAFAGGGATNVNLGSNFFTSNAATAGSGGALYFSSISATGFSASTNHFSGNTAPGATGSRNIYNNTASSISFLNAYLEGSTYATCDAGRGTNLGIADQCSGVGTNTTTITGVTATTYTLPSLCINDPTVSGCVGAR